MVLAVASVLVVLPGAQNPFNLSKALALALACLLATFAVARGRLPRAVLALGAGSLLWMVVAALASTHPMASLVGRWPRYEGLPVLLVYALAAWTGARLLGADSQLRQTLLYAASAVSGVLALATVLDQWGVSPLGHTDEGRSGSLLGNATDQGLVAAMLLLLLAPTAVRRRSWWSLGASGAAAVVLVLSGSRASLLVVVVMVLVFVALSRRAMLPLLGLVALGALALCVPQMRERLLTADTVRIRLVGWDESWRLGLHHLGLGVGPSGYVDAIGRYQDHAWVRVTLASRRRVDSPHSWVLQALDVGGLVLVVLAVALAVVVVLRGWRAARLSPDPVILGLLLAVVGYGLGLLVNPTAPGPTGLAALFAGALVAVPGATSRAQTWAVRALAAALVLWFGCAAVGDVFLARGIEDARAGEVGSAQSTARWASRLRPGDVDVHVLMAQALAERTSNGDAQVAGETGRQARAGLRRVPESYEARVALAVALLSEGDLERARSVLTGAVDSNPVLAPAYVQRGIARFGLRDVEGALRDLRRAHRLDPHDPAPVQISAEIRKRVGG